MADDGDDDTQTGDLEAEHDDDPGADEKGQDAEPVANDNEGADGEISNNDDKSDENEAFTKAEMDTLKKIYRSDDMIVTVGKATEQKWVDPFKDDVDGDEKPNYWDQAFDSYCDRPLDCCMSLCCPCVVHAKLADHMQDKKMATGIFYLVMFVIVLLGVPVLLAAAIEDSLILVIVGICLCVLPRLVMPRTASHAVLSNILMTPLNAVQHGRFLLVWPSDKRPC